MVLRRPAQRWLGFLGLVGGIAFLILFFYPLVFDDADSALDFVWPIAFLSALVWVGGTSVELVRRIGRADHGHHHG